jgi:hypothetical protein
MKLQACATAILITLIIPSALSAEDLGKEKNPPLKSFVRPLDLRALAGRFQALPERSQALIRLYFEGARRYVLTREDGAFPAKGAEQLRNLAERGHGAAVLAALAGEWPDDLRERCRRESAQFVRDFVAQFEKDHTLGNSWQGSWWAAEMGTTAWFVWDRLDPALQEGVAKMVAYHADHIAGLKPGARINLDTEAETVAWNSTILALAANMMPGHPHNAKWREAERQYVYTIFGTPHDLTDGTPGDDGKPVKEWVVGANIHDDFSLENHNRFHIDYELTCYRFLMYGAAMHRLAGDRVPAAFRHHAWDVYEQVLLKCLDAGKFTVYVSDNDWKRYHAWTESPAVHGYVALLESSPLASALEEQSLREAVSYWREFPPKFGYANPYVCGKAWTPRIADIVLLHLLLPPPPPPVSTAEVEAKLRGAHQKTDVNLLTHYSREGSFRSVYWGPGPTVRHIEPRDNSWMLLPLTPDYGVALDGKPAPEAGAKMYSQKGADWFWTLRRDARGVHEVFVSLPEEIVVVMSAAPLAALKAARKVDSLVAVEKPHKTFTVFYHGGKASFHYGQKTWDRSDQAGGSQTPKRSAGEELILKTSWVNLADSIGYVSLTLSPDPSVMLLPKPGVRSFLSLHHVEGPGHDQCFVTAAFPNQDHQRTEAMAAKVTGSYSNGILTCEVPPYFVWANLSGRPEVVRLSRGVEVASDKPDSRIPSGFFGGEIISPPNHVGILHLDGDGKKWSPLR